VWYFSWILGTGLAIAFAVLNAMWYEVLEEEVILEAVAKSNRSRPDP
jgi:cytochrome bd-I ubiquinol oxidase subunit X